METKVKWSGHIDYIFPDGRAVIVYTINGLDYEIDIDLRDIPEDCRNLGQYCRIVGDTIEWCREVWTQEEIEEARKRGKEMFEHWKEKNDE